MHQQHAQQEQGEPLQPLPHRGGFVELFIRYLRVFATEGKR
jgi:hypothetical protein